MSNLETELEETPENKKILVTQLTGILKGYAIEKYSQELPDGQRIIFVGDSSRRKTIALLLGLELAMLSMPYGSLPLIRRFYSSKPARPPVKRRPTSQNYDTGRVKQYQKNIQRRRH